LKNFSALLALSSNTHRHAARILSTRIEGTAFNRPSPSVLRNSRRKIKQKRLFQLSM
jgi:hypothetical protein